jgi:ubiquinone/menaquinone biosynthesis C-methylase UbiE
MNEYFSFYNEIADKYPESEMVYASDRGRLREAWLTPKLDVLEGLTLDIGCGDGHYSSHIKNYVGVDMAWSSLTKRWHTENKDRVQGTAQNLPFRDSVFDNVVISECLEHISDREVVLKEIHRISKIGGTIIVTVPYGNAPFNMVWMTPLGDYGVNYRLYLHGEMNEHYITNLLASCGFREIQTEKPYDFQLGARCIA